MGFLLPFSSGLGGTPVARKRSESSASGTMRADDSGVGLEREKVPFRGRVYPLWEINPRSYLTCQTRFRAPPEVPAPLLGSPLVP